jgi:hypothetical protein
MPLPNLYLETGTSFGGIRKPWRERERHTETEIIIIIYSV